MRTVVFLYNELLDEKIQKELGLPLEFISFAYVENMTLYEINGKSIMVTKDTLRKSNRDNKVYGAIFVLNNSEKFLRILDASLMCSKSMIGRNHDLDVHHRTKLKITPIHIKSIEDFLSLKYNEVEQMEIISYMGNVKNKTIREKVQNKTDNRVKYGFDINNFINILLKECKYEE